MNTPGTIHRPLLVAGAMTLFAAVALGAFGAHGLEGHLTVKAEDWWETAVRYHLAHGLGILLVATIAHALPRPGLARLSGWLMLTGVVLFCGSLYLMALVDVRWLALATPLGGMLWLAAWAALAGAALRPSDRSG
ncbi:MAG: DUF423 domain-containing protein [Pseudomonadota bacterium]